MSHTQAQNLQPKKTHHPLAQPCTDKHRQAQTNKHTQRHKNNHTHTHTELLQWHEGGTSTWPVWARDQENLNITSRVRSKSQDWKRLELKPRIVHCRTGRTRVKLNLILPISILSLQLMQFQSNLEKQSNQILRLFETALLALVKEVALMWFSQSLLLSSS